MSQSVKNGSGDGAGGAPKRPAEDTGDRGGNKAARASLVSGTTSATCAPPKPISMSFGGLKKAPLPPLPSAQKPAKAISIRLGGTLQKPVSVQPAPLKKKSSLAAAAFGGSDSDGEEEMPPEAKMRMKNIGRETPTSAGPNSFGKTKNGFCNNKKTRDKLVEGDTKEED